jgi:hypothetical protein
MINPKEIFQFPNLPAGRQVPKFPNAKKSRGLLSTAQFGVILYQPSQVLFQLQEVASKPKNSFI